MKTKQEQKQFNAETYDARDFNGNVDCRVYKEFLASDLNKALDFLLSLTKESEANA